MPTRPPILVLAVLLAVAPRPVHAQDSTAISAAVVAAQQLDLGEQWYRARCLECHAVGALSNADFQIKWGGRSAYDLYDLVRRTMPEDSPGSMTGGTYAAVVAYLMRLNGMPVGTAALPSDSAGLSAVRLSFGPRNSSTTPH